MQEGFRCALLEQIIPNVKQLIEKFNGKIIFSCFENQKRSMFETSLKWKSFQSKKEKLLLDEFKKYGFPLYWHNSYTVLNKELLDYINENKFSNIYLSGIYTDVCIVNTAMDGFDSSLKMKVVADCCTSLHSEKHYEMAMDSIRHIIGKNNVKLHF
ncbi:MAG: hypothetical protein DRN66_00320 [Candidatus Nanohalarchaeota archaeon]|nr:MAG: hypothetical protein DRN66_00320 [Candidatus Nanohaloarchaeota archaeon]